FASQQHRRDADVFTHVGYRQVIFGQVLLAIEDRESVARVLAARQEGFKPRQLAAQGAHRFRCAADRHAMYTAELRAQLAVQADGRKLVDSFHARLPWRTTM